MTGDVMHVDMFVLLHSTTEAKKHDAMMFLKHLSNTDRTRKEVVCLFFICEFWTPCNLHLTSIMGAHNWFCTCSLFFLSCWCCWIFLNVLFAWFYCFLWLQTVVSPSLTSVTLHDKFASVSVFLLHMRLFSLFNLIDCYYLSALNGFLLVPLLRQQQE